MAISVGQILTYCFLVLVHPGDLNWRERAGTSCQIENYSRHVAIGVGQILKCCFLVLVHRMSKYSERGRINGIPDRGMDLFKKRSFDRKL